MAQTHRVYIAGLTTALCLAASPVMAEDVLYCTDTEVVGFGWDKAGKVSRGKFDTTRFTIKVVSSTERIIAQMEGDTAGSQSKYGCRSATVNKEERLSCSDMLGQEPWVFYRNTYTCAFLAGPPAGGGDPNILVAYGTCTKF